MDQAGSRKPIDRVRLAPGLRWSSLLDCLCGGSGRGAGTGSGGNGFAGIAPEEIRGGSDPTCDTPRAARLPGLLVVRSGAALYPDPGLERGACRCALSIIQMALVAYRE